MNPKTTIEPLRYDDGVLHVLDQTRLPAEEVWLELRDVDGVAEAIRSLRVRGAPLIGIAAAYGIAIAARRGDDLEAAARVLRGARPTAVNLAAAVDRVVAAKDVQTEARRVHEFEVEACRAMGGHGAPLLADSRRVMTYCNTGALATGGIGTALGVVRMANERRRLECVWVPETRPLLQGARLTTWELARLGIAHRLIADAAAGIVFARGEVDCVVVGADRIAANGDTANKVGTYVLAVLAARHGVPFYVAAPSTTIDPDTVTGAGIPIEERDADEVRGTAAPREAPVSNPAFDVTPGDLITAIVTERGVLRPPYELARRDDPAPARARRTPRA